MRRVIRLSLMLAILACPGLAFGQSSVIDVLQFLMTNRSVVTDDFVRDDEAARRSADAVAGLLVSELGRLPIAPSAGGFTYRFNPQLGAMERASESFGPFFVERALTNGRGRGTLSLTLSQHSFSRIDGQSLRDGTLLATSNRLLSEPGAFDVESIRLQLTTRVAAVVGSFGLTDRLDVGAAVPFVSLKLEGERIDNYRGRSELQASGTATSSGVGDVALRAKYRLTSGSERDMAIAVEVRLPTGNTDNLLGSGETRVHPRLLASLSRGRFGLHGLAGPVFGGSSGGFEAGGAATVAANARVTIGAELVAQRLNTASRLVTISSPHPQLSSVITTRLTAEEDAASRLRSVVGVKWNIGSTWLISAHAERTLRESGLTAGWIPMISVDYAFGR